MKMTKITVSNVFYELNKQDQEHGNEMEGDND